MKKSCIVILLFFGLGLLTAIGPGEASAVVDLQEWGLKVGGSFYTDTSSLPAGINVSGFDFNTGLGTITATFSSSSKVILYVDHEIDQLTNGFLNEVGAAHGLVSLASGQSWGIGGPGGWNSDGTIYTPGLYDNAKAGILTNGVSPFGPGDVSMALGQAFTLDPKYTATVTFKSSMDQPLGFYLAQNDPDSNVTIYFSETLDIKGGTGVPEPGTMLLVGSGLVFLAGRRKMRKSE